MLEHKIDAVSHYYNVLPNWVGGAKSDKLVYEFLELAQLYINTILDLTPECVSIFAPIDIIDTFKHYNGIAYIGSAVATGEGRAEKAASLALSNTYSLKNYKDCKVLLLNFTGGESLSLQEINDAAQLIVDKYDAEETIYSNKLN